MIRFRLAFRGWQLSLAVVVLAGDHETIQILVRAARPLGICAWQSRGEHIAKSHVIMMREHLLTVQVMTLCSLGKKLGARTEGIDD